MFDDTSKVIHSAFFSLLREKGIDSVTVTDIVKRAHISRNTFYYHYKDMDDLLSDIISTEAEKGIHRNINSHMTLGQVLVYTLDSMITNKENAYQLYHSSYHGIMVKNLQHVAKDAILRYIALQSSSIRMKEEDKQLVSNFISHAMVGLLLDWMDSGMKQSAEEIVLRAEYLFGGTIETTISRSQIG